MYSPKISEDLIPILYREAKARRIPMTKLVDLLLRSSLTADHTTEEPIPCASEGMAPNNQVAA